MENILSKKSKSRTCSWSDNWRLKKKRKKKCVNDMVKHWACCLLQRGIHFLQETGRDPFPASPPRADSFDWPLAPTRKRKLPRAAERYKTCLQSPPFEIPRNSDCHGEPQQTPIRWSLAVCWQEQLLYLHLLWKITEWLLQGDHIPSQPITHCA